MRCMTTPGEWRCAAASVPPGRTATFRLECGGGWPNDFFTEDGRALICSTHGAIYEPATGLCTAGPCVGDRLSRLPLRLDGDTLVVTCP